MKISLSLDRISSISALILGLSAAPILSAQAGAGGNWNADSILRDESFVLPPANVERMILAPRVDISYTNPSPDRSWFIRHTGPNRGDIADYGKAHLWLGGVQVDTQANRARSLTTSIIKGLTIVNPKTGASKNLETPRGARSLSSPVWSPTGKHIAFIANYIDASHAYVVDVESGRSSRVSRTPLLATLVTGISWTSDGRHLLAVIVPASRGPVPVLGNNGIESGPQVRLSESRAVPQPVHFSLLGGPHDKEMLEHYTVGQLALLDIRSRNQRTIGEPQVFRSVDVSPDGQQFRITRITKPYSYVVPVSSFGTVQEIWDLSGKTLVALSSTPLREANPRTAFGPGAATAAATDTGKRNIQWNPIGAGLVYLQNIVSSGTNGGRGTTGVRYVSWLPPYGASDTSTILTGGTQFSSVVWSKDGSTMFINDSSALIVVRKDDQSKRYRLPTGVTVQAGGMGGFGGGGAGAQSAAGDTSGNGRLLTEAGTSGDQRVIVSRDGKSVFVSGSRTPGARWRTEAPRPWIDRLNIESGERSRVFYSASDYYEAFVTALDDDLSQFIYTKESATTIQDAWLKEVASGATRKLTENIDVATEVTGAQRKRLQVVRHRDGTRFWVDVTLPADWRPGTRLPGIIWFYPREYASLEAYERSRYTTNINQFPVVPAARPATATSLWVAQGYAFIQPDLPIYGEAGRMNDNYTRDLAENLDAVVDAMVDSGYVDRHRMGIGGHSYGAFSTVNAMTLVPYFKAGIAGDGMYNRTLTPFGFQSERRNFFEAQDTYLDMSPFLRADKLSGALLLYHATEDQNVGTAPMSSVRMYQALHGLGKNASLYMYPYEDHSVATYQSDLDMWARWFAWFEKYVKNAPVSGVSERTTNR